MSQFLSSLATNLAIVGVFAALILVGLKVAQSIFGAPSTKASAIELAARLTSLPAASGSALRRRFARSLTSQFLVMPSGERHALSSLRVRISPEDADRLAPDGDLELIGYDGARLYATHARRQGWRVPESIHVSVETDPVLRPGWIPPARGVRSHDDDFDRSTHSDTGDAAWSRIGAVSTTGPVELASSFPSSRRLSPVREAAPATVALAPEPAHSRADSPADDLPTLNVAAGLILARGADRVVLSTTEEVVIGRGPQSPLVLDHPEISTRHAALRHRENAWHIMDLGSTNGTSLDGEILVPQQWRTIGPGSKITLAGVELAALTDDHGTVHVGMDPVATGLTARQGQ